MSEFVKNPSKIDQNDAQYRFENDLGEGSILRPSRGVRVQTRTTLLWHHLGDFGRFWGPLKIQGGAKNDPKNLIRRVGVWKRPRERKKSFFEGLGKCIDF